MSASLENQFISDRYTSLLHLSGSLTGDLDYVYDGLGNQTPIQVSNETVVINNVEQPPALTSDTIKFFDLLFPINSIYFTADNINPTTRFSGTKWEQVSKGKFIGGVGAGSDTLGYRHEVTSEDTDTTGLYEVALTESELPKHSHSVDTRAQSRVETFSDAQTTIREFRDDSAAGKGSATDTIDNTNVTGKSEPHCNIPPTYGLYVWKRTA
tara:strand:+ start:4287 stop:4919 length:633 start_codon:yes stop_codon:yes gene_type:complete